MCNKKFKKWIWNRRFHCTDLSFTMILKRTLFSNDTVSFNVLKLCCRIKILSVFTISTYLVVLSPIYFYSCSHEKQCQQTEILFFFSFFLQCGNFFLYSLNVTKSIFTFIGSKVGFVFFFFNSKSTFRWLCSTTAFTF